jgi:hypothetical protein
MTIYEGDMWEENPYELSCQTGIITGEKCNHKGLVEKEKIILSDYKTKEEMHALMIEKGFTLKSEQEMNEMRLRKQTEIEDEERQRVKHREEVQRQREVNAVYSEADTKTDEL